jgi:hypothetical protein
MYVWMHACMHVCMYGCMHACMHHFCQFLPGFVTRTRFVSLRCGGTWEKIKGHSERSYLMAWDTEPDQLHVPPHFVFWTVFAESSQFDFLDGEHFSYDIFAIEQWCPSFTASSGTFATCFLTFGHSCWVYQYLHQDFGDDNLSQHHGRLWFTSQSSTTTPTPTPSRTTYHYHHHHHHH